jgi:hypothetical protein
LGKKEERARLGVCHFVSAAKELAADTLYSGGRMKVATGILTAEIAVIVGKE